jgi:flagellar hook-length control protein FliK
MTPLITSILSTTSQALTNSTVTDLSSTGGLPFESILNGAMLASKTSHETPAALSSSSHHTPLTSEDAGQHQVTSSSTQANAESVSNQVASGVRQSHISELITTLSSEVAVSKVPSITQDSIKELATKDARTVLSEVAVSKAPSIAQDSIKELATKDARTVLSEVAVSKVPSIAQDSIKELATKDARTVSSEVAVSQVPSIVQDSIKELATKDQLMGSSDSEKITNPVKVIDELTTQKNQSEFVDAQILMASVIQQQQLQAQPQSNHRSFEVSAASPAELSPREFKIKYSESMPTSKLDSLAMNEKVVDHKTSSSLSGISIDTDQLQNHLALRTRPEITEQLAQIQAKLEAIHHRPQESAPSASFSMAATSNQLSINPQSAEQSFAFLAKDQSGSQQFGPDNQLTSVTHTSGVHFGEHLNKVNSTVSENITTAQTQSLPTPFQSPDWGPALSQRVTWMVKDQLQNANITINPPHLGQIEVRLQTDQSAQTSVYFMSNNPEVRQAITENLNTLREMMSQNGLQLGQADVGSRESSNSSQYGAPSRKKEQTLDLPLADIPSTESSQKIGLINTYA